MERCRYTAETFYHLRQKGGLASLVRPTIKCRHWQTPSRQLRPMQSPYPNTAPNYSIQLSDLCSSGQLTSRSIMHPPQREINQDLAKGTEHQGRAFYIRTLFLDPSVGGASGTSLTIHHSSAPWCNDRVAYLLENPSQSNRQEVHSIGGIGGGTPKGWIDQPRQLNKTPRMPDLT